LKCLLEQEDNFEEILINIQNFVEMVLYQYFGVFKDSAEIGILTSIQCFCKIFEKTTSNHHMIKELRDFGNIWAPDIIKCICSKIKNKESVLDFTKIAPKRHLINFFGSMTGFIYLFARRFYGTIIQSKLLKKRFTIIHDLFDLEGEKIELKYCVSQYRASQSDFGQELFSEGSIENNEQSIILLLLLLEKLKDSEYELRMSVKFLANQIMQVSLHDIEISVHILPLLLDALDALDAIDSIKKLDFREPYLKLNIDIPSGEYEAHISLLEQNLSILNPIQELNLCFADIEFSDDELKYLAEIFSSLENLEKIVMRFKTPNFTDEKMEFLLGLKNLGKLQKIELYIESSHHITDTFLYSLASEFTSLKNLESFEIYLEYCKGVTPHLIQEFNSKFQNSALRVFDKEDSERILERKYKHEFSIKIGENVYTYHYY